MLKHEECKDVQNKPQKEQSRQLEYQPWHTRQNIFQWGFNFEANLAESLICGDKYPYYFGLRVQVGLRLISADGPVSADWETI